MNSKMNRNLSTFKSRMNSASRNMINLLNKVGRMSKMLMIMFEFELSGTNWGRLQDDLELNIALSGSGTQLFRNDDDGKGCQKYPKFVTERNNWVRVTHQKIKNINLFYDNASYFRKSASGLMMACDALNMFENKPTLVLSFNVLNKNILIQQRQGPCRILMLFIEMSICGRSSTQHGLKLFYKNTKYCTVLQIFPIKFSI